MKKLTLSAGVLTLLVAAFVLMSAATPKSKVPAPAKKPTITFTINNTSTVPVSYSFKDAGGLGPHNVVPAGGSQMFAITPNTYQVILNAAGPVAPFHMLFNTGENWFAPGHTFPAIVVSSANTTSLNCF